MRTRTRRLALILTLALALPATLLAADEPAVDMSPDDFATKAAEAKTRDQLLVIDFYTDW